MRVPAHEPTACVPVRCHPRSLCVMSSLVAALRWKRAHENDDDDNMSSYKTGFEYELHAVCCIATRYRLFGASKQIDFIEMD